MQVMVSENYRGSLFFRPPDLLRRLRATVHQIPGHENPVPLRRICNFFQQSAQRIETSMHIADYVICHKSELTDFESVLNPFPYPRPIHPNFNAIALATATMTHNPKLASNGRKPISRMALLERQIPPRKIPP